MALDTFAWKPAYTSSGETKATVNVFSFGDGYSQRAPRGLNNVADTLALVFRLDAATWQSVDAFLRAKAGATPFLFSLDGGPQRKYVCDDWKPTKEAPNLYTVQATFTQVFTNQQ
ncbi:phage tail protein [Brachymonas sp.]|uniref:phage tail protein n=1 Tax=Brachymonas sp. TaxID=1936292 RepID=UPI0035AF5BB2